MRPTKAVVLAAGHDQATRELLLKPLGNATVIELVLANVTTVVSPADVVIVVDEHDDSVRHTVGPGWTYVPQSVQAGTGDAVRCARFELEGFAGDVLIAYGDTPLLRADSLKGLLNRHRLKQARFSLLSARLEQPGHYGRIVRDDAGALAGIVESTDLDDGTTALKEINVGAYVVANELLVGQLDLMAQTGEHRLTELAKRLINQGVPTSSYVTTDTDEVQGINTAAELRAASDIVLKRLFAPHREVETGEIAFGTGGWRARIGEGFTLHNVRRLCQAIANAATRAGVEQKGVVIGGDRRFLSAESVRCAAEVFAGNNIPVMILPDDVPTPLVTFAAPFLSAAYSLVFTASHNPPQWNGLKVFRADGSLPLDEETDRYSAEANSLSSSDVIALEYDTAVASGMISIRDITNDYVDAIEQIVDVEAIRAAGLRVIVDPMYGTSQLTLGMILSDARARVQFIHERHNPLFGGRSPAPDPEALSMLIETIKASGRYSLGMATDGDADRIAIVDEHGEYISTNDLLLLIYWYMHEERGERGGVVRNLATTSLLDRLAESFGEQAYETPVGFKFVTAAMLEHDCVLGGESSGGLTIRGHILGKDGVFACALVVEMLARTKKSITELRQLIWNRVGRLYSLETSVPATPQMRVEVPRRLDPAKLSEVAGEPVLRIDSMDGIKIHLPGDSWVLLRFSGTEPVLRIFVEAPTAERAEELLSWANRAVAA
ncbi:MAG: NTP transferase domain-containing protein [Propionibacteriaceae bacterium]|jgi:phosphomannomutase/CTP:molybdopterin cytidylyltransferase MocA|nr:NTP transferase domain-containing protein [Propionibacteriaceae bacterium]